MLRTRTRYAIDPATAKTLDTDGLRSHLHLGALFAPGEIDLAYSRYDRLVLGSAVPDGGTLTLTKMPETGTVAVGGETRTLERGAVLNVDGGWLAR